ncbi:MAG: hypothetical protein WBN57_11965 [Gammaproteobacteria bacterium]
MVIHADWRISAASLPARAGISIRACLDLKPASMFKTASAGLQGTFAMFIKQLKYI